MHERHLVWTCTIRTRTGRVYFAEALDNNNREEAVEAALELYAKDHPQLTIIDGALT